VSEDSNEKRQMKAFKKCLKLIAKADGVKKKEVFEGIIRHHHYREQEEWVKEMQEKYPPPK
jgi:hypothetical protein